MSSSSEASESMHWTETLSPGVRVLAVSADEVGRYVQALQDNGARMADFFGSLEGDRLVLRLIYGDDRQREYRVIEWGVDGREYCGLSDIDPAAFMEECEVYEQFGARPNMSRPLNRLAVPPHAGRNFPRLGAPPPHEATLPHAAHYVKGQAIEFPFGPVRAVAQESLYMGLVTTGEEVIELYLLSWHKHRAIERRLRGLTIGQALFAVERAEGLSAVAQSWAFCRAVEAIYGLANDEATESARLVALELERLYNHAASIVALCQATGLSVGQAQAEIALEELLRVNLASFGHRYLFGALAVGGSGRDLDGGEVQNLLPRAYGELRRAIDALWSTNSFIDRLESTGVVPSEAARRLGLVGPVARASGYDVDARRDHPFGMFDVTPTRVALRQAGDVLARMQVMAEEAEESFRMIAAAVKGLGLHSRPGRAGKGTEAGMTTEVAERVSLGTPPGEGGHVRSALGWSESSRGECLVWLSLSPDGRVQRGRLRPGSVRNWRAFDDAARSGNVFTDIPIIEASFWLTVAGLSR